MWAWSVARLRRVGVGPPCGRGRGPRAHPAAPSIAAGSGVVSWRLTQPRFAFGPDSARRLSAPETSETFPTPATRMSVPDMKKTSAGTAASCEIVTKPVVHGKPLEAVTMFDSGPGGVMPGISISDTIVPKGPAVQQGPPGAPEVTLIRPKGPSAGASGPNIVVCAGAAVGAPGRRD